MAIKKVQAMLDGQTYELTLNPDTGNYEKTVTAPTKSSWNFSGHYYPVVIKAVDLAENEVTVTDTDSQFGDVLKLRVKETTAPVSEITSPTDGAQLSNAQPTITWKVTDDDSGVDSNTISITIDTGKKITSGITKARISGGYLCSYNMPNPLGEGTHAIKVDASDFDGNNATQRIVNVTVDVNPPSLSVDSPVNNLMTNKEKLTVSGTTSDIASSPCKVTVQINSEPANDVPVDSSGDFSTTVKLKDGANTIIVTSTDRSGKSSTVQRIVTLDRGLPIIESVTFSKNPVLVGEVFTITAKVIDT